MINPAEPPAPADDAERRRATPLRLVLVDDHAVIRAGLARLLDDLENVDVRGQASNAADAIPMIAEVEPDLVIADYSLPDKDAPELIADVLERWPKLPVIVLSIHENQHYALRALRAGARGYLVKSDAPEEVEEAIMAVASGESFITSRLRSSVTDQLLRPARDRSGLDRLSDREFQLLRFIVRGLSLQEAAVEMKVSESTVSTYRRRLIDKLGVKNNAQLVRLALEHGIDEDEPI